MTIVGDEADAPYNRILLSQVLTGQVGEAELALRHPQWFADRGVKLRLGAGARTVDTTARKVELADGEVLE